MLPQFLVIWVLFGIKKFSIRGRLRVCACPEAGEENSETCVWESLVEPARGGGWGKLVWKSSCQMAQKADVRSQTIFSRWKQILCSKSKNYPRGSLLSHLTPMFSSYRLPEIKLFKNLDTLRNYEMPLSINEQVLFPYIEPCNLSSLLDSFSTSYYLLYDMAM